MDVSELSGMLTDRAEHVAAYLLPQGKLQGGREWAVGSTGGEQGDSLKVCVSGAKVGVWSDFATGEKGDLLDLWIAVRGLSMVDALKEVKEYLGVE